MLLALAATACSDDDGQTPGSDSGAGSDALVSDGAAGRQVKVVLGQDEKTVDLSTLATVKRNNGDFVSLDTVVKAAFAAQTVSQLQADFESADGFRPAKSPNCTGVVPIGGDKLDKGFIQPDSGNLAWDDSLSLPGCMGVRDVAIIELSAK
jgi:hypothetical protein